MPLERAGFDFKPPPCPQFPNVESSARHLFALDPLMFESFNPSHSSREAPSLGTSLYRLAASFTEPTSPLLQHEAVCLPQVSTLQTLAEQRSLHLLPPPKYLPLELGEWTSQLPHISVVECYADLAMHGCLARSMHAAQYSLPATLAVQYLHAACFLKKPGQLLPFAHRSNPSPMDLAPARHDSEGNAAAAFTKPSANNGVQDSLLSKLQGLKERLELGCPLDVLQQVQNGTIDDCAPQD